MYKCTTAITSPEAWNAAHWTATSIGAELAVAYAELAGKATTAALTAHTGNKSNPHGVTPAQTGAIPTTASCNKNWIWAGQPGQPNWLWGGNDDPSNMYVYNPANFNVNYANGAGNAGTVGGYSAAGLISAAVAAGCQIATGSYTGTGTYGSANKTTFVFPFAPKLMIIMASNGEGMILIPGSTQSGAYWSAGYINGLSDGGTDATLSTTTTIYSYKEPFYQMNRSDTSYYYLAIG